MGILISSFIGCGRRYFKNTYGDKVKIFDAVDNINVDEEEKESLEGYFNKVMEEVSKNDIVFIGSSEKIRDIFNENNVDYDIFYPSSERRGEFIENQVRKHTNPKIIMSLDRDFDKMISNIDRDESENCYKHKLKNSNEFIGNSPIIMQYIDSLERQTKTKEGNDKD